MTQFTEASGRSMLSSSVRALLKVDQFDDIEKFLITCLWKFVHGLVIGNATLIEDGFVVSMLSGCR